jgi:hypothetical protein
MESKSLEINLPTLMELGPIIEAEIHKDVSSFLHSKNFKESEQIRGIRMLIDTGSNISGLDRKIIDQLELSKYEGLEAVHGVGGAYNLKRYNCILYLPIFEKKALPLDVLEGDYSEAPFDGVLGRDLLQYCRFTYDGWNNTYVLSAINI